MSTRLQLFESASGAEVDVGIEFIDTVQALLRATEGDPAALDELGDLLTRDDGSERVRAVVDETLKLRLRQFATRLDQRFKGSQWLRLLLTPVGQLPYDVLDWSWNQRTVSAVDERDGLRFALGGGRGAAVARTAENDLQYRFDVLLGAAGRMGMPWWFRNGVVETPRARLEYRFEHPSHVLLLDAMNADLSRLAHVLEPELLPDSNVKRIELDLRGQVLLSATRTTAACWSTLRNAAGNALQAPRCINAHTRFELQWSLPGHFTLQLRPDPLHGTLIASLVCADGPEPARVLSLGGNFATRGLERVVRPLLMGHGSTPPELIDLAERFSRPCELMQEHLEQTLNERPALAQELRGVLLAGNPVSNAPRTFTTQASMDMTALLDQRMGLWDDLLQGECAAAVEFVLARLGIAEELQRFARAVLQQWLGRASKVLQDSLFEELEEVLEQEPQATHALGGEDLAEKLDDADSSDAARRLLSRCTALIERVRCTRQRILDAVEEGVAQEFGLALGRDAQHSPDQDVLLEITLNPRHEAARDVYRQILMGDFRAAISAGVDSGQPHIMLDAHGLLAGVLSPGAAGGFCFDIIEPEKLNLLEQALSVEHRVGGRIRIGAQDLATQDERPLVIDIPAPLVLAAQHDAMPLAITLDRKRADLRPASAQRHLHILERAGLLAAGTTSAIALTLGESEDPQRLRLAILLLLSRAELERACARDRRDIERVTIEEQIRIVDSCLPRLRLALMLLDDRHGGESVAFVQSLVGLSLQAIRQTLAEDHASFAANARLQSLGALVHSLATNAERMVTLLERLQALGAIELETPRPGTVLREKLVVELEAAASEIAPLLSQWAVAEPASADEDAFLCSYAFATSLRRLCGIDRNIHPLVAAVGWRSDAFAHFELAV